MPNNNSSFWNPSASIVKAQLESLTDDELRKEYLTKTPYNNYSREFDDILRKMKPNDPNASQYLFLAALGGRDNGTGATKYIENYIASNVLPYTIRNKEYVHLEHVCRDIDALLASHKEDLLYIIRNNNSNVTPFIKELCSEYFGYLFDTRLKVKQNAIKNTPRLNLI